ncbi:MAG: hypothetical protein AMK70_10015 [Nitrospira bacterium SG8_35_1]|nr:MAG: hypothetical protein AMK70_10015 [Nitrospira bacterium SG8_35_1]
MGNQPRELMLTSLGDSSIPFLLEDVSYIWLFKVTMELFVAGEHSQLYDLWLERKYKNIAVCHVDFHCDMRGLLIDRRLGKARYVWQSDPYMKRLDSGSFLSHAVMNGIVINLRWVHDEYGGRKFDDLYCVKYETDFTALPFLLPGRQNWVPVTFQEQTFAEWGGPQPDEHLSIDWDGIAFKDYDREHIRTLMAKFSEIEFEPQSIFVCRSPEYSHPDKALFDEFINGLEEKFKKQAKYLPLKQHPPLSPSMPWKIYHNIEYHILRLMRRVGIY